MCGWLVDDGWLAVFYGILTLVGYLMPNPFLYKYIQFVNEYFEGNIFKRTKAHLFEHI